MKKIIIAIIAQMFLFTGPAIAQAPQREEITLVTYYPAPYGEYDQLSAKILRAGSGSRPMIITGTTTDAYMHTAVFMNSDTLYGVALGGIPAWGSIGSIQSAEFNADGSGANLNVPLVLQRGGGNVGIGLQNPSPAYKLHVDGAIYASGSSLIYKENISDLDIDVNKIYELRPVSFDYKAEYRHYGKDLGGKKQIGLIAEEVYEIIPELAVKIDGQISNVDFESLGVVLLAALKEQKAMIENLMAEVNKLKESKK